MTTGQQPRKVLLAVHIGFAMILLVSWLDEFVGLPDILAGNTPDHVDWAEGAIESVFILIIWLFVAMSVRTLTKRLYYLEKFLRVCAWCRKINLGGEWVPIERYFREGFATDTTHGMCPECMETQYRKYRESRGAGLPRDGTGGGA